MSPVGLRPKKGYAGDAQQKLKTTGRMFEADQQDMSVVLLMKVTNQEASATEGRTDEMNCETSSLLLDEQQTLYNSRFLQTTMYSEIYL
jgi:hypothetical protein